MKKLISILLIILSVTALPGGFLCTTFSAFAHTAATSTMGMYYVMHYSWFFWLFMPIPIGSILFGIFKKQRANLIVGSIFTALLLIFGCFYLFGFTLYSTETAYLDQIETSLTVDLPDNATIIAMDWTTPGTHASTGNTLTKKEAVAHFHDDAEVDEFIDSLDTEKWLRSNNSFEDLIPITADLETDGCEYFLLYCYETDRFSDTTALSEYNYVYLAFDSDHSVLHITEFAQK